MRLVSLRRPWAASSAVLLLGLCLSSPAWRPSPPDAHAQGTLPAPAALAQQVDSYRLVDSWQDKPEVALADRLSEVPIDLTTTAEGWTWVLTWGYLEAYDPQGQRQSRFRLDQYGGHMRVDATPAGDLWVLNRVGPSFSAIRYGPDGRVLVKVDRRFDADTEYAFDIAATTDGGFALTRSNQYRDLPSSIDVSDALGNPVRRVYLTVTIAPGLPFIDPMNLDVDADGRFHLTYQMQGCCSYPPAITATPTPTRPSVAGAARATPVFGIGRSPGGRGQAGIGGRRRPQAAVGTLGTMEISPVPKASGILLLSPEGLLLDQVDAFYLHDIVTGAAGTFVASSYRLWEVDYLAGSRLDESRPDADLRRTQMINLGQSSAWPRDYWRDSHLALRADGQLFMTSGSCFLEAVLTLGPKATRYLPTRLLARYVAPRLEGPPFPIAMAGQAGLGILQGPFALSGQRRLVASNSRQASIQRWSRDGAPLDLLTLCGNEGEVATDLAVDGDHVYHISPHLIWSRPDNQRPEWGAVDDSAYFVAAAADAGRVAVLDARRRRLLFVAAGSGNRQTVDLAALGLDARSVLDDLALDGQELLLADIGRDRIVVFNSVRGQQREFPTHDGPKAVASGPEGAIFVLGRGGWGLRYSAAGALEAVWPMPKRLGVEATDISVGQDGRVYVSFVGIDPQPDRYGDSQIREAGVWVFEPAAAEAGTPKQRPSGICLVTRDKTAAPARLPLGDTVEVTLSVGGDCPRRMAPHQVVFVLDTSGSMEWDRSLDRAKAALIDLLAAMDPWVGEAALITFNSGAQLDGPLSHDLEAMRAMVAGVRPLGDTLYGAAIELARLELAGARGDPAAQRTIVVVTDGGVKDDPSEAIAAAKAEGIGFLVLAYPNNNFRPEGVERLLRPYFGAGTDFLYDVGRGRIEQTAERLRTWITQPGLFATISVRDEVPGNMELLESSIQPPAAAIQGRTIVWSSTDVLAADGLTLRYRLRPLEAGLHPTNVQADADYVDTLGNADGFRFPVPRVEVFVATPTPTPIPRPRPVYLPLLLREVPLKHHLPLDIVLVLDTSSSMAGAKLDAAKAAVWYFLDGVDLKTARVALVGFDGTARTYLPLLADALRLKVGTAGLVSGQGTRIDLGLAMARAVLEERTGDEARRDAAVILLTDGRHTGPPEAPDAEARALRAAGVRLHFVGLGADVDPAALQRWAEDPAAVHLAPGPEDLEDLYGRLARVLTCLPGDYWGRRCGGP